MNKCLQHIKSLVVDEEGATAIEYGLLTALIAAVIIVGAGAVGTSINTKFSSIANTITTSS